TDTRYIAPCCRNRIVPSRFHVAPASCALSVITNGFPPESSTRFSLRSAKNPICLLSGDQKGTNAPSVPGKGFATDESIGRTHMLKVLLPGLLATNARCLPSGDICGIGAMAKPDGAKAKSSVSEIENSTGARSGGLRLKVSTANDNKPSKLIPA